uniref:Mucin-1 n=1 Tax=Monodon monoceros TaxID=40151 RepID=A0A8C6BQX6_MONMO
MTQASNGTPSSVPSSYTPTISASSTNQNTVPPYAPTSSSNKTSQPLHVRVSLFFLYFRITNLQFNSSLENPSTSYYQKLQRIISVLFVQTYKQEDFLGLSDIEFSLALGCLAGSLPFWYWSVFWLPWPSFISLPWLCVSADKSTVGSWTSFQSEMPTIL